MVLTDAVTDRGGSGPGPSRTPTRVGFAFPPPSRSRLPAISCRRARGLVRSLCRLRPASSVGASQPQQRVQLPDAQQPAQTEEGGVPEREPRAERDDLRRKRPAELRVERVPDRPPEPGERRRGNGHEATGPDGLPELEPGHPPSEENEQGTRP